MKVRVVDDEVDIQPLFEQRFRKERKAGRIEFHFAFSGEAALDYIEQQDAVDLVLIPSCNEKRGDFIAPATSDILSAPRLLRH
jgi:DNA-binding NtrC family response regulator